MSAPTGCSVEGCGRECLARGLCASHYRKARNAARGAEPCTVEGCGRPAYVTSLCRGHYARKGRQQRVEGILADYSRGSVVLVCRLPVAAREVLERHARDSSVTANKLASRLLCAVLGLADTAS